jgi:predicted Zn-dependent protease
MGRSEDQQIVESVVVENDPLLNAYVEGISNKLWAERARYDVPYSIKIISDPDINAFSTMGGYVYVNEGLIDFVQSDDELAGVIGHETGHIERRHEVTMPAKEEAINMILGIASIFSPLIYQFGNLVEATTVAKLQRAEEIQADRTGLQLMSRAGYDPEAMVTMMQHLGALNSDHSDLVTKYLQDHPGESDRIKHLVGYPELDPTQTTENQKLIQAASDEERDRYSYSSLALSNVLQADPGNAEALLDLGQDQLALGLTSKSEQTLSEAAQKGDAATRAQATQRIAALRQVEARRVTLTKPNLTKLQASMQDAQATQAQAAVQIQARRDQGRDQIKAVNMRFQDIQYEVPDFSNVNVRHGSRLEAILKNLNSMARAINSAISDSSTAIDGVGSLEKEKESGLLKENSDILKEMQAPLAAQPIPADSVALLPSYPSMLAQLAAADGDMLRSVDAGRASLVMLDQSIGDLDEFLKQLGHTHVDFAGDINQMDYDDLLPLMKKASTSMDAAAASASEAAQLYNMARSRQLGVRISMLGVGTSPQRYATLQDALQQRFGFPGIDYATMLRDNLTPGEVTAATILAADIKSTPAAIIAESQRTNTPIVDLADQHGMHAWPLEIFMGLVYLDYTDNPVTEMHPGGSGS